MIKKTGKGYKVTSESGKNLSKDSLTKGEAEERLRQVEYFKHEKQHGNGRSVGTDRKSTRK